MVFLDVDSHFASVCHLTSANNVHSFFASRRHGQGVQFECKTGLQLRRLQEHKEAKGWLESYAGKDANFDNVCTSCDNLARAIGERQVISAGLSLLYAWGMSVKDVRDQLVQTTKTCCRQASTPPLIGCCLVFADSWKAWISPLFEPLQAS